VKGANISGFQEMKENLLFVRNVKVRIGTNQERIENK